MKEPQYCSLRRSQGQIHPVMVAVEKSLVRNQFKKRYLHSVVVQNLLHWRWVCKESPEQEPAKTNVSTRQNLAHVPYTNLSLPSLVPEIHPIWS